ncbi:MAG TPA: hypothetical protein VMV18_14880 [bacterium]|nr:hypothetical protein [bacterium]
MRLKPIHATAAVTALVAAAAAAGCSGGSKSGTGNVQVFITPEDSIVSGIPAGTADGSNVDNWTVTYNNFLINFSDFRAHPAGNPSNSLEDTASDVLDLFQVGANGYVFKEFDGVSAVRYDKVGYDIAVATSTAQVIGSVTNAADAAAMVSSGYAILFDLTMTNPSGQSCTPGTTNCVTEHTVHLRMGIPSGTHFDDCSPASGAAGFAVPSGGTAQIKPTIHGDHWFFINFPHGANESPVRRAQWLANADLDHNGEVTVAELTSASAANLFPSSFTDGFAGYDLSGALGTVNNGYDFIVNESHTLGHFEGDGDCATRTVIP